MKKTVFLLFALSAGLSFISCNMATPENYFDEAVLNCNMMMGFAGEGLHRELDQPSAKLVEGTTNQTAPMKRKELVTEKIQFLEDALTKIKKLKETDDTRNMLKAAVAVYNYVLPVYKTEYLQLARLYDDGAPQEQVDAFAKNINEKYFPGFQQRLTALTNEGKPYAARHNIKVNWDIKTTP